jgi:tripartite-type tricarboxylate transporter receptor subunit TctC
MASAKTPADVLDKIRADVGRAMRDPVVIKRIKDLNSTPVGNTAEEFRQVIKDDLATFRRVITDAK